MTVEVTATDDMMDFSVTRGTIKFRIDEDVFEAPPDIAAELALRFADESSRLDAEGVDVDEQIQIIHKLFRMILLPASADRFIARLGDSHHPIGADTFQNVTRYLLEQYGLRPTEPGSDSSAGSDNPDAGTRSRGSVSESGSTSGD